MSNAETVDLAQDQWSAKPLTEAQQKNRDSAALIPFTEQGMSPQNFAQVVDFSKHMAQAKGILGPHLVGNYAGCLAIIELAQQFKMRPFMLARQTYFVNGMIAFDGQAIMSIMNLHMPLAKDENGNKTRLMHRFEGEKAVWEPIEIEETDREDRPTGKKIWISKLIRPSTRKIILTGRMEKEATVLEYESPPVFQIKNKKSPLWEEDEDQQLIYWGSRRWQRRHWPEGMLGIVDREEAMMMHIGADNAKLIEASNNPGQALLERVAAAKAQTTDADQAAGITSAREGFSADHAHKETTLTTTMIVDKETGEVKGEIISETADHVDIAMETKVTDLQGNPAEMPEPEPEHEVLPTTVAEWKVYALAWINAAKADPKVTADDMNKHWKADIPLRNNCGVSGSPDVRDEVYDYFLGVRDDKPKDDAKTKSKKK